MVKITNYLLLYNVNVPLPRQVTVKLKQVTENEIHENLFVKVQTKYLFSIQVCK